MPTIVRGPGPVTVAAMTVTGHRLPHGTATPRPHTVAVLLYEGMSPFETGIVSEVFGLDRPELGLDCWYELKVCAPAGAVRGLGGLMLHAAYGLAELSGADTVVVPGVTDVHGEVAAPVVVALRGAYERGARLVSICSGAFALAAAGLLDGRRAATHWRYARLLQQRYPSVQVDADVLYVDDGQVLTSAGSAAGLDLCLHLVRCDHGSAVANVVARRLVAAPYRDGGQAQFVEAAVPVGSQDGRVAAAMAYALGHLAQPLTVADLAAHVGLDPVTYRRHFRAAISTSPSAYRRAFRSRVTGHHPLSASGFAPAER